MEDIAALTKLLAEVVPFLEQYEVRGWSKWFRESAALLDRNHEAGIEKVLNGFGGMGSFNDLVICALNQHRIADADESAVNNQLDLYRTDIYQLATQARSNAWKHSE